MYRKILLPTDGSELAGRAMSHAVAIARAMDSEVVVLRVVDTSMSAMESLAIAGDPATGTGAGATFSHEERVIAERAKAEQELSEMTAAIRAQGIRNVTSDLAEGDAGETIVARTKDLGCDLVVMSSHGRSGIRRAMLGSVTDHVVRHTPHAAVLVIGPGEE